MPVIIIFLIVLVWIFAMLYESAGKSDSYNRQNLEKMLNKTVGKSKKEARKIVKKYRK